MKPFTRSIVSSCALLALIVGLGWSGRVAGKRMARAGWLQTAAPLAHESLDQPDRLVAAPHSDKKPREIERVILRLKYLIETSPDILVDWETRRQIQRLLSELSSSDLGKVYASIEGHQLGFLNTASYFLAPEVLAVWTKLDPASAMIAGFAEPQRGSATRAFASWAAESPNEALDWLASDDFPPELSEKMNELRIAALANLLSRDFDLATQEFFKVEHGSTLWSQRDHLIGRWASQSVNDPELREKLVEFSKTTGRPEDHAHMNSSLLRDWPQEDALGMLTYMYELRDYQESGNISAEKQPEMDAIAVRAAIYREYDGPALEWWMERYSDQSEVPGPLQSALSQWQQKYPDAVNQWFAQQPDSPQRDAMQASRVPSFIASGKMEEAARAIYEISDPGIRQNAIERLDYVWSKRDPEAAAAWRRGE